MEEELNFSFSIDIKEKVIYINEESGSGAKYGYENIDDIGENIKFYLENYYQEKIENTEEKEKEI